MTSQRTANQPTARSQRKWSPEEDALITELRGKGMKWEDISKRLAGRSAISCRLRYQNYLERRIEWDEQRKNKLARLYERFKPEMWAKVAEEMAVPWRAAEAMHWQLGEANMAQRAGVIPFSLATVNAERNTTQNSLPSGSHVHSHTQGTISHAPRASPPWVVYNSVPPMPANSQTIIARRKSISLPPPLPLGPDPAEIPYVLGPASAPMESQPPPRNTDTLPGFAEIAGGVSPNTTSTAVCNMGAITRPGQGPLYSSHACPSMDLVGSKRKASSPDRSRNKVNRRR
ncbi:unnamed protein product [Fusarium langsethiae]|nr:unnamed protein product [Fusarium langsethiae]